MTILPSRPPAPDPVHVAQGLCAQVDYALRHIQLDQLLEIVADRIEGTIDGEGVADHVADNVKVWVLPLLDDAKHNATKYAPKCLLAGDR